MKALKYPSVPDTDYTADTEADLTLFLVGEMTSNASPACGVDCMTDISAYLWQWFVVPGNKENGEVLMASSMCVSCHANNGDGTFGGLTGVGGAFDVNAFGLIGDGTAYPETEEGLTEYLTGEMPYGGAVNCVGTCSADISSYLWSLRD